jgi:hypothetical protein
MISNQVTLEYLEEKLIKSKFKKRLTPKMFHLKQRQFTDSTEGRNLSIEQDTLTPQERNFNARYSPKQSIARRFLSTRKTEMPNSRLRYGSLHARTKSEKTHAMPSDSFCEPKQSGKWKTLLDRNEAQRQRYKDYLSKYNFELSFEEKLKKQN